MTPGNEVHHCQPKAQGGTDDPSNLETMCHACHTEADAIAKGIRPKQRIGEDGWPV